jgi:hypothetical protein
MKSHCENPSSNPLLEAFSGSPIATYPTALKVFVPKYACDPENCSGKIDQGERRKMRTEFCSLMQLLELS